MEHSEPFLQAEGLHWKPEDKLVLDRVDCHFAKGKISGVVGANGAGKSSLLRALQGLTPLDSGEVFIDGKVLAELSRTQRAQTIAAVPQSTALLFSLTAYEVVRMALIPWKSALSSDTRQDRAWLEQCMKQTGCIGFVNRNYNSLSGGEQQRVLLARALAQKTEIILLDEPTSHLDIFYQHEVLMLLKKLNKTIVLSIHDLNLAAQYCDEIVVLKQGQVLMAGAPKTAMQQSVLQDAFGLPCSVAINPGNGIPTVCFHPELKANG
ncbi:ABC transporter ATP-binding protein [Planctobacterium marinum]|uniref:ABC transporter ATP-binding protein n=1 Tax=Planctobacterium marinum TaxID=1631968 RepID=A0AA48HI65_9ALTE|nr:ABC transporter ATP-binding protein [Planctobacterium marinum]